MTDPSAPRRSAPLAMRPAGLPGRLFGRLMEWLNADAYARTVDLLVPQPRERFLEIGFGTGRLVELLLDAAPHTEVAGIDPIDTMLAVARRRADLRLGDATRLPWPDDSFDAVAALHSFQFWPDPPASLDEIARVLRPGGRPVLVLRDHSRRPPAWLPNPLSRSGREVEAALALLRGPAFAAAAEQPPVGSSRVLVARAAPA